MKKLLIISWSVFILGVVFRLFHISGVGMILILGGLMQLVHSLIFLFKNSKTDLPKATFYLSLTSWTVYFVFRLLFLPGGPNIFGFRLIFILPYLFTIFFFIFNWGEFVKFKFSQMFLISYFVFGLVFSYVQSDRVYYFLYFQPQIHGDTYTNDFEKIDNYSWYLNLSNKHEEAIAANSNAQKILGEAIRIQPKDKELLYYQYVLNLHRQKLLANNWEEF